MQAIRDYGRGPHSAPHPFAAPSPGASSPNDLEGADVYVVRISQLLEHAEYTSLDAEAQKIRTGGDRLRGGGWKLNTYYAALCTPSDGPDSQDSDWQAHIDSLKKWISHSPQSAAARVALACTYAGWAGNARGTGTADTVTEQGWRLFKERMQYAKRTLVDASHLSERCPGWFFIMQTVARGEGWSKSDEKELYDQAVAFEPGYYYFYQSHAEFLLPKWYGSEQEVLAFINDAPAKFPEPDSSLLYFELTEPVACQCNPGHDLLRGISWEKVKAGYATLERAYGTNSIKDNRYAFLAYMAQDKTAAAQAFALVGDNPDHNLWSGPDAFEAARSWATTP